MANVGIVGIGFMGMMHYLAYQKVAGAKVVAICEKLPERLRGDWTKIKGNFGPQGTMMDLSGVAAYDSLEKLLADRNVDMVDVCLPPAAHGVNAVAALDAGKNVLCEKPMALTLADAEAMVAAAKRNNKLLMIGHVLPFFPSHAFVYDAMKTNRYGKLLGGHFNRVISDPTWLTDFYDMNKIGGPLLDLHIHDAHFIRLLFGMPKAVQSVGRMRGDVPEYFNTQFLFDDKNLVVTSTSGCIMQQGRPFTHGYEVHFEKATLLCESFSGVVPTVLTAEGKVEKPELPQLDEVGIFTNEMIEATTSAANNKPSAMLDGILARDALLLCHKEMEAVRSRERVTI
ncbi:MAG: Gfo/Idh/MocA family oxidoreductase [Planctomycetaceae bacterium]|nr:Gfo/Idh/MocA family oxidoreductase [Planctomycetaceae bacterium]